MSEKRRVLFLCTGNSVRSQMAEGLVNHFLGDRWQAFSAGTRPAARVHPLAVQALAELGIDISAAQPKPLAALAGARFDLVITVCADAAEDCPYWPGGGAVVHMGFVDPSLAPGGPEEQLAAFRHVRDRIRARVLPFLESEARDVAAGL